MIPADPPRSLLILAREHIGDLVCTTPALRSLRRLYPDAHIVIEGGERAVDALAHNPNLDEILVRPAHQGILEKMRFVLRLRRRRFDLGVTLDDTADAPFVMWLAGIPRRVGLVRKPRFARFYTDSLPLDRRAHEMVDNFRAVVALLGGDVTDAKTEVYPDGADRATVDRLFAEAGLNKESGEILIALNPGASAPANRWLPERFAELADLLLQTPQTRVLLLGGPGDQDLADAICACVRQTGLIRLTGRLSVLELAETLGRCAAMATGDTGPMHLAVAMGTPVVALFGPAVPSESGPGYATGNVVIRHVTGCPLCTKYVCRDDRRCMKAISAEEVARALAGLLARKGKRGLPQPQNAPAALATPPC